MAAAFPVRQDDQLATLKAVHAWAHAHFAYVPDLERWSQNFAPNMDHWETDAEHRFTVLEVGGQRARALTVTGLFERIESGERREAIRARLLDRHAHLREFIAHPEAEVFAVKIHALQLLDGITDSYYETVA